MRFSSCPYLALLIEIRCCSETSNDINLREFCPEQYKLGRGLRTLTQENEHAARQEEIRVAVDRVVIVEWLRARLTHKHRMLCRTNFLTMRSWSVQVRMVWRRPYAWRRSIWRFWCWRQKTRSAAARARPKSRCRASCTISVRQSIH